MSYPFQQGTAPPVDVEGEVIEMAIVSDEEASETTSMAVQVKKFGVDYYRHQNRLLRVNQMKNSEVSRHDVTDGHVLFLVQCIRAYGFGLARETISVTAIATTSFFEACEGAPLDTACVLNAAASVVLREGRSLFKALTDL